MSAVRIWLALGGIALSVSTVGAETKPSYEARAIAPTIFELVTHENSGLISKVVASVGEDGLLIVDSGTKARADALLEALGKLHKGPPRYVIDTHSHAEHLGGQEAFGKGPVIIGHANLRDRYTNGLYVFNGKPVDALPQVTFTDRMSLHFNGEEIALIAMPGAHDDSDIIVWFTKSKVVCTEALCNCHHFPSVDAETGDVTRYPEVTSKLIGMLPDDVVLVPGHADDCNMEELRRFHEMLVRTKEIVREELAKGKTPEQLRKEDVLASFASYESYMTRSRWLDTLVAGLTVKRPERGGRAMPYGLLYKAYKEKGAEGTIALYEELKANKTDAYFITEDTLLWAGRRVIMLGQYADGIRMLEQYMKEYPGGANMVYCHLGLASAHEKLGQKEQALVNYKLALARLPDEASILAKVKELSGPPEAR
jgi:cyclase